MNLPPEQLEVEVSILSKSLTPLTDQWTDTKVPRASSLMLISFLKSESSYSPHWSHRWARLHQPSYFPITQAYCIPRLSIVGGGEKREGGAVCNYTLVVCLPNEVPTLETSGDI